MGAYYSPHGHIVAYIPPISSIQELKNQMVMDRMIKFFNNINPSQERNLGRTPLLNFLNSEPYLNYKWDYKNDRGIDNNG